MGKRSNFARVSRDFYPTPREAVAPLLPHLAPATRYVEPCAGKRHLVRHLEVAGHHCVEATDIVPDVEYRIYEEDARTGDYGGYGGSLAITNPPWNRSDLHPIISNLARQMPTWLLFDSDWLHTRQSAPFLPWLRKVVSVGRVKWIPDSKMTGKDNCCWYLFDASGAGPIEFVGRA